MTSSGTATSSNRRRAKPDPADTKREKQLLADNIDLILQHEKVILSRPDYFLVELRFATCCIGVVNLGVCLLDADLCLGHLLTGWREGSLTKQCEHCGGTALIGAFSGNMQRRTWWDEFCPVCRRWVHGSSVSDEAFEQRCKLIKELVQRYPEQFIPPDPASPHTTSELSQALPFESLVECLKNGDIDCTI